MTWKNLSKKQKTYRAVRAYNAKKYKTVKAAAASLNISTSTLRRWSKRSKKFTYRRPAAARRRPKPKAKKQAIKGGPFQIPDPKTKVRYIDYVYDIIFRSEDGYIAWSLINQKGKYSFSRPITLDQFYRKKSAYEEDIIETIMEKYSPPSRQYIEIYVKMMTPK